jgi:hypothetical protein
VYGYALDEDMTTTGTPLANPPLIDMISNDPILSGVKVLQTPQLPNLQINRLFKISLPPANLN